MLMKSFQESSTFYILLEQKETLRIKTNYGL